MSETNSTLEDGRTGKKSDDADGNLSSRCGNGEQPLYRDADYLEEQYHDKGKTQKEIADECGVHHATISDWMNRLGVDSRYDQSTGVWCYFDRGWQVLNFDRHTYTLHRIIALQENHVSEVFDDGKVVHHKGGCKFDNRTSRLDVIDEAEHTLLHHWGVFVENDDGEPELVFPMGAMDDESAVEAVA